MAIFNRSHYEDVLAARVHHLVPERVWKRALRAHQRLRAAARRRDVIVLKFYLHISRDEQYERLLRAREGSAHRLEAQPRRLARAAAVGRVHRAYEDALDKCATREAPWYLVPADKKWFRNLAVVFERLVLALRPYRNAWLATLKEMGKSALREIQDAAGPGEAAQP